VCPNISGNLYLLSQVLVAQTYTPSYAGGRNEEDLCLRPTSSKIKARPFLKNIQHKKGLVEWLKW
jgi:hypothetical protein